MAKNQRRTVQSGQGAPLPGFEYDVRGTFLPVEVQDAKHGKQLKGVLDVFRIRPANQGTRGDVQLRFLSSLTIPTHSELFRQSGLSSQPVMDVSWKGLPFSVAGRFTDYGGRLDPIKLDLFVDTALPDRVQNQRGYESLVMITGLAMASAVFVESKSAEVNTTPFEFHVHDDFLSGGAPNPAPFTGRNIGELAQKLQAVEAAVA